MKGNLNAGIHSPTGLRRELQKAQAQNQRQLSKAVTSTGKKWRTPLFFPAPTSSLTGPLPLGKVDRRKKNRR